jgi:hypothetical protein
MAIGGRPGRLVWGRRGGGNRGSSLVRAHTNQGVIEVGFHPLEVKMGQNMMVYWVVCLREDVYTSIPPISFKSKHIFFCSLRPGLCIKEMNVVSRMWTLVGSDKGTQNFQACIHFRSLDDPTANSFKFGVHFRSLYDLVPNRVKFGWQLSL